MKLLLKINLVLIVVFLIGLVVSYQVADQLLQEHARSEVEANARMVMESVTAVRAYTNTEIGPILSAQTMKEFLPQSVAAYSAIEVFTNFRQGFPDFSYKEAMLNPTNPRDRAVSWEVHVVNYFRANDDATELLGERDSGTGKALYLASPIRIRSEKCLACHGKATEAPQAVLARYGSRNGFGWQFGDIVGAQIVSVPYELPLKHARATLTRFTSLLVGLFSLLFLAVNILLITLVVRPLRTLTLLAEQVSLGNMDAPDFPSVGRDEVAALGVSFNRLRTSLRLAMNAVK